MNTGKPPDWQHKCLPDKGYCYIDLITLEALSDNDHLIGHASCQSRYKYHVILTCGTIYTARLDRSLYRHDDTLAGFICWRWLTSEERMEKGLLGKVLHWL